MSVCLHRIFNISSGKQKKLFKGSQGEDGTLIKVRAQWDGCRAREWGAQMVLGGEGPVLPGLIQQCVHSSGADGPLRDLHCYQLL